MRLTIAALVLAMASCPASGEQGRAQFTVAVTVPTSRPRSHDQPTELTLSAEDVARGYKEVSARYRISHNDRNGYLLRVAPRSDLARYIEVRGLGANVVLGDDGVDIALPGDDFQQELALTFHFELNEASHPGTFELPVSLDAIPL